MLPGNIDFRRTHILLTITPRCLTSTSFPLGKRNFILILSALARLRFATSFAAATLLRLKLIFGLRCGTALVLATICNNVFYKFKYEI